MSRNGPTSSRKLYRAIQNEVNNEATSVKQYVSNLLSAQEIYLALRDPDNSYWSESQIDIRDALLAYRRFGFESSTPVLIAAFQKWNKNEAIRLMAKIANWSIRAQFAGRLGGGVADETIGETASAISSGSAKSQTSVREGLARLIPDDSEFKLAFSTYGDLPVSRAKYLLAMLEKSDDAKNYRPIRALEWSSRAVTIEHIQPQSTKGSTSISINQIGNHTLLEKRFNKKAGNKPFVDKKPIYSDSQYELTRRLAELDSWDASSVNDRN